MDQKGATDRVGKPHGQASLCWRLHTLYLHQVHPKEVGNGTSHLAVRVHIEGPGIAGAEGPLHHRHDGIPCTKIADGVLVCYKGLVDAKPRRIHGADVVLVGEKEGPHQLVRVDLGCPRVFSFDRHCVQLLVRLKSPRKEGRRAGNVGEELEGLDDGLLIQVGAAVGAGVHHAHTDPIEVLQVGKLLHLPQPGMQRVLNQKASPSFDLNVHHLPNELTQALILLSQPFEFVRAVGVVQILAEDVVPRAWIGDVDNVWPEFLDHVQDVLLNLELVKVPAEGPVQRLDGGEHVVVRLGGYAGMPSEELHQVDCRRGPGSRRNQTVAYAAFSLQVAHRLAPVAS